MILIIKIEDGFSIKKNKKKIFFLIRKTQTKDKIKLFKKYRKQTKKIQFRIRQNRFKMTILFLKVKKCIKKSSKVNHKILFKLLQDKFFTRRVTTKQNLCNFCRTSNCKDKEALEKLKLPNLPKEDSLLLLK